MKKISFVEVKKDFEEAGFILLEKSYSSCKVKMKCICLKHPNEIQEKTYDGLKRGRGCCYCSFENSGKTRSGKNNNLWKGGITKENKLLRGSAKHKQWREKVLKRDNYICQCCGNKDNPQAHHIKSFSEFKELRFDVNNGITLCENCHALHIIGGFHNIFGIKFNTEKQLNDYIEGFNKGKVFNGKNKFMFHGVLDSENLELNYNGNINSLKDLLTNPNLIGKEFEIKVRIQGGN